MISTGGKSECRLEVYRPQWGLEAAFGLVPLGESS